MQTTTPARRSLKQHCLVAMVLGTALSGMPAASAETRPEAAPQVVNDLSRYCTVCWRNAHIPTDDWNDCTQAVFCRLLERLPQDTWARALADDGSERREFLRAIDTIKKRSQRSRRGTANDVEQLADHRPPQGGSQADERDAIATAAQELLTARQKRILDYSFDGWSVNEIADELHTKPERVSDEKYKAIQKLKERLVAA